MEEEGRGVVMGVISTGTRVEFFFERTERVKKL